MFGSSPLELLYSFFHHLKKAKHDFCLCYYSTIFVIYRFYCLRCPLKIALKQRKMLNQIVLCVKVPIQFGPQLKKLGRNCICRFVGARIRIGSPPDPFGATQVKKCERMEPRYKMRLVFRPYLNLLQVSLSS